MGQDLVYISLVVTLKYSEFRTENYLLRMIPKINKDYFSVQHWILIGRLQKSTLSPDIFVSLSAWKNASPIWRISWKLEMFIETYRQLLISVKLVKYIGQCEELSRFMISRRNLPWWRKVQDRNCRGSPNKFNVKYIFSLKSFYLRDNYETPDLVRSWQTIWWQEGLICMAGS
jgi:hypothetical protein